MPDESLDDDDDDMIDLPLDVDDTWRFIRSPDPIGARELCNIMRHVSDAHFCGWESGVEWSLFAAARFPWHKSDTFTDALLDRVKFLDRWIGGWVVDAGWEGMNACESSIAALRVTSGFYGKVVHGPVWLPEAETLALIRALQAAHRQPYMADFRRYLDQLHEETRA